MYSNNYCNTIKEEENMSRRNKKESNARVGNVTVGRKPKKRETIHIGEKVVIQNNGKIDSQTIVSLGTFNGDLYL